MNRTEDRPLTLVDEHAHAWSPRNARMRFRAGLTGPTHTPCAPASLPRRTAGRPQDDRAQDTVRGAHPRAWGVSPLRVR